MYKDLLETDHRPFAMPTQPWVMTQTWDDLLFMHWRIPVNELSAQIAEAVLFTLYECQDDGLQERWGDRIHE